MIAAVAEVMEQLFSPVGQPAQSVEDNADSPSMAVEQKDDHTAGDLRLRRPLE
jgi:hypothetical protein